MSAILPITFNVKLPQFWPGMKQWVFLPGGRGEHILAAAVHVSHNLGIPFDQIKAEMMTGSSLAKPSISLSRSLDARQEAVKGNQHALEDMENTAAEKRSAAAAGK